MKLSSAARQLLLCTVTIAALLPLAFMLMTSLKSPQEYAADPLGLPTPPTVSNYVEALVEVPTLQWAWNSLVVTVVAVLGSTVIAALAAYAIAFGRFRGRSVMLNGAIGLIMVPPVVLLLPMFVLMVNLQLVNRLWSVMLFYSCLLVPFATFFLVNFFRTVPREVIEAAVVDGAGPLRTLWAVVLPISRPALATIAVVNAVWAWNELLIALIFLQTESERTLMGGLSLLQGRYATNQPLVLAVAVLSILPVAVFYLLTQRAFVRGLTAGMGK